MTLRHLEIFVAVCEYGGITRAAEALHIAQPAISHTIADLEKFYNITLFDRISQRLVLTETGRELLPKARALLEGFCEFEEAASEGGNSPRLKIGASLTLGQTVIPAYLCRLENAFPQMEPHVVIRSSADIEEETETGNLDFALVEGEIHSPYLTAVPFRRERLVAVAHAQAGMPDCLTLEELTAYPLIIRERGSASREFLERAAAALNLHIQPKIESANNQAIVAAVFASLGVAFLPDSFVRGHIEREKFREIRIRDLDENLTNYLVMHKNKRLNAAQKAAYDLLKEM